MCAHRTRSNLWLNWCRELNDECWQKRKRRRDRRKKGRAHSMEMWREETRHKITALVHLCARWLPCVSLSLAISALERGRARACVCECVSVCASVRASLRAHLRKRYVGQMIIMSITLFPMFLVWWLLSSVAVHNSVSFSGIIRLE